MSIVKDMLNGAKLPNWVYLFLAMILLGFQAGIIWAGQKSAVGDLKGEMRHVARMDSVRADKLERLIIAMDDRQRRAIRQGNQIHGEMWRAIRQPDRYRDIDP